MRIMKRSGEEHEFNITKIIRAVEKANAEVPAAAQLSVEEIRKVAGNVESQCLALGRVVQIEEIQDMVENELMKFTAERPAVAALARAYITYRYKQGLKRQSNTTDDKILGLVDNRSEEVKEENANKNSVINSTQRDYIAGEVSRDLTRRILMPPDVIRAHDEGIIHVHDTDYHLQHMHNCDLINLEDMLQNGTVISGTKIDKPKSFGVAANVTTQIIAQVASNQYGGQTISLSHLAPFVDVSRQKIRKNVKEEFEANGITGFDDEAINRIAENRLKKEIANGVQTIQYQLLTLMTTNGQAPFISVMMYLNEVPEGQTKDDLALIIEETLKQRMKGVKNADGVWVNTAFPKLLYVLEEDNVTPDSKYWYLTELAAKCTAKRMVPDYISEKIMKEYKIDKNGDGQCYPCINKTCA